MEAGTSLEVHVVFTLSEIVRGAKFTKQEASNVLVVIEAGNIKRCSTSFVLLNQELKNVILVQLLTAVIEAVDDLGQLTSLHRRENSIAFCKILRVQVYRNVYPLFLGLLLHFLNFC